MKIMKKKVACILLAAMLFASCSNNSSSSDEKTADGQNSPDTNTEITETAEEETEYDIYAVLPEMDYDGRDFIFYIPTNPDTPVDKGLTAEELTGVTFDDAVYNRNLYVDKQYDVVISSYQGGWYGSTYDDLKPNVLAGDNVYDVYFTHVYSRNINMFQENLCMEWKDIPYIQTEKPWWNQYANTNINLANKSIFAVSSINIKDVMTFLFNKEMADAYISVDAMYQFVEEGKWTFDKVLELTEDMTMDLNGDGKIDANNDQFGLVYGVGWQIPSLMYACDVTTISLDENGYPTLLLNDEHMLSVFEKMYKLLNSPGTHHFSANHPDVGMETNRAFIVLYNMFTIETLRDGDVDYGILPLPKYDEAQEKYMTNSWVGMMCLPTTTPVDNYEMIGVIMESMSYTGYTEITPLFYDNVLKAKLSRDEDSARMLDIILENTVYDLGCVFQTNIHPASFMANLINSQNENYMSQLQKQEKIMIKQYEKIYDSVADN